MNDAGTPALDALPEQAWLVWGVKDSFLAYLQRMPDSEASVGDGAGATPDSAFAFPRVAARGDGRDGGDHGGDRDGDDIGSDRDAGGDPGLDFGGELRIVAHAGLLDFRLAEPRIARRDGRLVLTARMDLDGEPRTALAALDPVPAPGDDPTVWFQFAATLLESGCHAFNDVYPPGTELAPVRLASRTRRSASAENS